MPRTLSCAPRMLRLLLLCLCLLPCGCGSWRISDLWRHDDAPAREQMSPGQQGPVQPGSTTLRAPVLPPGLAATQPASTATPQDMAAMSARPGQEEKTRIPYATSFACAEAPALADTLKALSLLEKLRDSPPDDFMGLDYRIRSDEDTARKILRAHGYHDGQVERQVDTQASPVQVRLTLKPGTQYRTGRTEVRYDGAAPHRAPRTLDDAGLAQGSPAVAEEILNAIDAIPPFLRRHGYPLAEKDHADFAINPETKELYALAAMREGPLARMSDVRMEGSNSVNLRYFQRMRNWRKGQLWNEGLLEAYQDVLNQQGLFRSVNVRAVPAAVQALDDDGLYADEAGEAERGNAHPEARPFDVLVSVEDGPQKSVGGGLYYDSERGMGGQAFWEHRNLFGQAESLRTRMEIWNDTKELSLKFAKPGFLSRVTALVSDGWVRQEETDAYEQKAAYADVGLQHRFGKYVWGTVKMSLEGGSLKDTEHPEQRYSMLGLPAQLRFDTTGSLLNATQGVRVTLSSGPYAGVYAEDFTVFPTRLDMQGFQPLLGEDRLVLALRGTVGSIWRNDARTVPASIRYYAGGGGSVRGYDYQSLGPRDVHNNPRGGASFTEASAEFRWKVTDDVGIVPFVDAGTVSDSMTPTLDGDSLQWSSGLGFRYYTAIGPIRMDVAMPLNPRDGDSLGPAFYISIGQAF
ncbi:MAG: BamA/TamA family outer membrane protein [Desulfovibrionaceae bacterium]|nr:BamA/TamA family outer membrane protein [Desulfovibrionaceae bacterium]